MLVKLTFQYDGTDIYVNPAFVKSLTHATVMEQAQPMSPYSWGDTGRRAFHLAGCCCVSFGGDDEYFNVLGTLDEVAAKLNGGK